MKKNIFICVAILFFSVTIVKGQGTAHVPEPKIILENNKIKVTEYNSLPGNDVCGAGKHNHPAHLTVLLTDATIKLITSEGKPVEQKAPAGTTFWSESESHTVINNGDKPIRVYIIEVKE